MMVRLLGGNMGDFNLNLKYNPGIDIRTAINKSSNINIRITDYNDIKYHNVIDCENRFYPDKQSRKFFHYCKNNEIMVCELYDEIKEVVIYKTDRGYNIVSEPIFLKLESLYNSLDDTPVSTFNFPDIVSFSSNGEVVTIARGSDGLIFIKDNIPIYISNNMGFRDNSEVTSAILGDDGFLYIALKHRGYVLRNVNKGNYTTFTDVVTSCMKVNDGILDKDTKVSNIVSTDNGIWFSCYGYHETFNGNIINDSGLYHYKSSDSTLTKIEEYPVDINHDHVRLIYTNNKVIVRKPDSGIDCYNPYTFSKEENYLENLTSGTILWNMVEYKDDMIAYLSEPNGEVYTNKLLSKNDFKFLDNITSEDDILVFAETLPLPNISSSVIYDFNTVICKITSFNILTVVNIHKDNKIEMVSVNLPFNLDLSSKLNLVRYENHVEIKIDNSKNSYDKLIKYKYFYRRNIIEEAIDDKVGIIDFNKEKIISKSLSKTNIRVSESFISGDNCISDFEATNIRHNEKVFRATKSFLAYHNNMSNIDTYVDRLTNYEVNINDMVNVKTGYFMIMPLGIGRDDCRIYLAHDHNNNIRLIQEYVSNNRDIVDINILNNETPDNNIINPELLGEPSPGSTIFSNVDYWYIGDINNNVVGIRYRRDGNGIKLPYIDKLIYLGVRNKYIVEHSILDDIEISEDIQIIDDNLSSFIIYDEKFKSFYISISLEECNIVDIFSRDDEMLNFKNDIKTIFNHEYPDVSFNEFFKSNPNFIKINNHLSCRKNNDIMLYIDPDKPISDNGLSIRKDGDMTYIVNSIFTEVSVEDLIEFSIIDSDYSDIDSIVLYIEIIEDYGDVKYLDKPYILDNLVLLNSDKSIYHLTWEKDPYQNNVYVCFLEDVQSLNLYLDKFTIYMTNMNVHTHNTKFRFWSNGMYHNIIERDDIGPEECTNAFTGLYSIYKRNFFNSFGNPGEFSLYHKNTISNNKDKFLLIMDLIPEKEDWYIYDIFEIFSMGDFKILAQAANETKINISIEGVEFTPISIDKTDVIGFKIAFNDGSFLVSIRNIDDSYTEIYNGSETVEVENYNFDILNYYFGDIINITLIDSIDEYYEYFKNYVGDNVYGKLISIIRDYRSGKAIALISPRSTGHYNNKGILKYELGHTYSSFSGYITKYPFNNLNYGDIGFSENSAFTLIVVLNEEGRIINIFERRSGIEEIKMDTKFLASVDGKHIVDQYHNKIKTVELY